MNDRQEASRLDRARTVVAMRSTVEPLRLAAQNLSSGATASPNPESARRLRALAEAASAQADDIQQRADHLSDDAGGA